MQATPARRLQPGKPHRQKLWQRSSAPGSAGISMSKGSFVRTPASADTVKPKESHVNVRNEQDWQTEYSRLRSQRPYRSMAGYVKQSIISKNTARHIRTASSLQRRTCKTVSEPKVDSAPVLGTFERFTDEGEFGKWAPKWGFRTDKIGAAAPMGLEE